MPNSRPRQFDLIAFDWDGTLFDSTAIITRCIQQAVVDVGGQEPTREAASYVIGMALMPALAHAAPDVTQDKYPALGERYRHHYLQHQNDISLFEGVLPLLDDLKARHHWLTVATGKSRQGLNEALQAVELRHRFDGSRTADETAGKPSPLMLHELMREFGVEPERTLMIGDTTHDLQMALNAGCASVGVSYGAHEPEAFHALNPLHVAHSVQDLHDWLLHNARTGAHMEPMVPLCNSSDLVNGGRAVPFDIVYAGQTCRAFAIRYQDQVHAYLNRCTHVAMEMDYQPDRFYDDTGRWLMCATHGATYQPDTGACSGGPCRGGLVKIDLSEQGGVVHWHTAYNLKPLEF